MINNHVERSNWSRFIGEAGKFFRDILRDTGSDKYSMTKFGAFVGLIMFIVFIVICTVIMINKHEIDHVLAVEIIGFVLTLLGFKNNFGYVKGANGEQQIIIDAKPDEGSSYHHEYNPRPGGFNNQSRPNFKANDCPEKDYHQFDYRGSEYYNTDDIGNIDESAQNAYTPQDDTSEVG